MTKKLASFILLILSLSSFGYYLPPDDWERLPVVDHSIVDQALTAVIQGDLKTIKRLISEGADPSFSDGGTENIFHHIASYNDVTGLGLKYPTKFSKESLEVMRYLISMGADPGRFSGVHGSTPLADALDGVKGQDYPTCRAGFIKVLLEGGADPDAGSRSGSTYIVNSPLAYVSAFCGNEAMEIYFSYNPDFIRGDCELPPLHKKKRYQDVLDQYIGNGAKTPTVMLFEHLKKKGQPVPSLKGPYHPYDNPEWKEWTEANCRFPFFD